MQLESSPSMSSKYHEEVRPKRGQQIQPGLELEDLTLPEQLWGLHLATP
jgi:hypothetical protein